MANTYKKLGKFSCDWAPVEMLDGSGITFVSRLGDLMPFRFEGVNGFEDGMAAVKLKSPQGELRYTYLSQDENLCPVAFELVSYFKGEFGYGYIGKEEYIVDRKFNVYQFKNTLIDKIQLPKNPNKADIVINNKTTGQVKKFDFIFEICGPASEGMLPIMMRDGSGFTFIDQNHNIMQQRFVAPAKFKDGKANVALTDGSLGYVNKEGDFTLLGRQAPKDVQEQKERAEKVSQLVDQLEQELGIKNEEFGSPFFKNFCTSQRYADKVLLEYIQIESEEEKEKFIKKYQASARDIEILDQTIAATLGEILARREEEDEDEDEDYI